MTTPEALNALADRVERDEPSRHLDELVYCATEDEWVLGAEQPAPEFTTSLDAAVGLVPEGWDWLLSPFDVMTCVQKTDDDKAWPPRVHGTGRTLAAALTAAALLARVEQARVTQQTKGEVL